jgi:hypothetical protein
MRKELITPLMDGESHPFFRPLPFTYRVSYVGPRKRTYNIEYSSVHEVILNMKSFQPDDRIIHINQESGKDAFTITFKQFSLMLHESMRDASPGNLEMFYGRLILTNRFSKKIADAGQLWHYDQILRRYLLTLRAGIDCHLAYERLRVILYLKYRRTSIHHLITTILAMQEEDDIHFCHINIPSTLENQGLLMELLRMDLPKSKFRIFSYDPHPDEDNIISTDIISQEIIQIINQINTYESIL